MHCYRFEEYVQGEPTGTFSEVRATSMREALQAVSHAELRDDYDRPMAASEGTRITIISGEANISGD